MDPGEIRHELRKYQEGRVQKEEAAYQEIKNYHYRSILYTTLFIGTGTFVLSISFIGSITNVLVWPWALIAAWVLLVLSIASGIISHWLGVKITERVQDLLDNYRNSGYTDPKPDWDMDADNDKEVREKHSLRERFDLFTAFLLGAGLVALIIFASANLLAQNAIRAHQNDHHLELDF